MKDANHRLVIPFENQQQWESWLREHHADTNGVWLKLAKKGSGIPSITYTEALESALCYGWIDGQKDAFNHQYFLQKFTPRRSKSVWSKINCAKVMALLAEGKMQPAGIRQMELAQADGRWDAAYASQRSMTIPDDLQRELEKNRAAQDFFNTLDRRNRYSMIYRIQTAKKPETRAARIQKFIEMLSHNEKIYP